MNKATMNDVAKRAKVSIATVSRVLNSPKKVRPETLAKVQKAIRAISYAPSLQSENIDSKLIAVIMPTTLSTAFADTLMGIQNEALKECYSILVGITNYESGTEKRLLQRFASQQLAGLILAGFSPSNEKLVRKIAASGTPCVVVWEICKDFELGYVGFDNFKAFYDLVKYLSSLGHKRIGFICGPYSKSERAYRRLSGYRSAIEDCGFTYDHSIVYESIPSLPGGEKGMLKIMTDNNPPSAVIAGADVLALGALSAARKLNIGVPQDVSVAGFDNITYAAYTNPPLTSVQIPSAKIGSKAVEAIVLARLDRNRPVCNHQFNSKLIIRESCAPIP